MKIKKGDIVKILSGKDRGKTGKVIRLFPKKKRVMVEGINVYKKHVRPKRQNEKGEIVEVARPINISNVVLICPSCSKPTRVGYSIDGENKNRRCKKCKSII